MHSIWIILLCLLRAASSAELEYLDSDAVEEVYSTNMLYFLLIRVPFSGAQERT